MLARRRLALAGGVAAIWYVCILVFWALQPLTDSVPVGIDYTLKTPAAVSVSVDCNSLFDSGSRNDAALPSLKPQLEGDPALAYQRTPCNVVHNQARIVFVLDTLLFGAAMGVLAWLVLRGRRSAETGRPAEPSLAGVPSS